MGKVETSFIVVLFMVVSGGMCATKGEIPTFSDEEGLPPYTRYPSATFSPIASSFFGENDALVQYKSPKGRFYQVRWDIYGVMFDMAAPVSDVFLRTCLMVCDDTGFVASEELTQVLQQSLVECLSKKSHVFYDVAEDSHRLCKKQISQIFPKGEEKLWQVVLGLCQKRFLPGEVRIVFKNNTFRGTPVLTKEPAFLKEGTIFFAEIHKEKTPNFIEEVSNLAQKELSAMNQAILSQGECVEVRYITKKGKERGALWRVHSVINSDQTPLLTFLKDCVLQGIHFGLPGQDTIMYKTFINSNIRKVLREYFVFDVQEKTHRVSQLGMLPFVRKKDLLAINEGITWTVLPRGERRRPCEKGSYSLTFSKITLEGIPFGRSCFDGEERMLPRAFLYALDYKNLTHSCTHIGARSERMFWASSAPKCAPK